MKILVLNGSPHTKGNTTALVDAFTKGAESAGHEVVVCPVGTMNIKACLACEYCHNKGEGKCVQKDDMEKFIQNWQPLIWLFSHRLSTTSASADSLNLLFLDSMHLSSQKQQNML